jgi:hypothetical protein
MSVVMLSVVMLNVVAQMKLTSSAKTIIWKQVLLDGSIYPMCKNQTFLKVSYNWVLMKLTLSSPVQY